MTGRTIYAFVHAGIKNPRKPWKIKIKAWKTWKIRGA